MTAQVRQIQTRLCISIGQNSSFSNQETFTLNLKR